MYVCMYIYILYDPFQVNVIHLAPGMSNQCNGQYDPMPFIDELTKTQCFFTLENLYISTEAIFFL